VSLDALGGAPQHILRHRFSGGQQEQEPTGGFETKPAGRVPFGATAIIWWEAMEWAVSKDGWGGAGGLALTYEDTIGDLILSSTGGLIGSLLGVWWLGRKAPPENDAV